MLLRVRPTFSHSFNFVSLLLVLLVFATFVKSQTLEEHGETGQLSKLEENQKQWDKVGAADPELGGSILEFDLGGTNIDAQMFLVDTDDKKAFLFSFVMIVVSEIGDKTFLIAAIMAMQHSRFLVFSAAFCALAVMSVLSATLGYAVPNLISQVYTNYLAALLFLFFGIKMAFEGWEMSADDANHELEEVTAELKETEDVKRMEKAESGGVADESRPNNFREGLTNLCQFLFSPIFVQTFILTFLAEWGDRSQIATIALAAAQNVYFVTFGTILGHSICTGIAVIGGRMLAQQISVRTVTLCGAVLFIAFAVIYLYEGVDSL